MFMAYPGVFYATDGEILLAMQQAQRTGGLVMMHAENGIAHPTSSSRRPFASGRDRAPSSTA